MICYRDRTYCQAACANNDCNSKYTEQVIADAEQWWGSPSAPICVADLSLNCPAYKPMEKNND